MNLWMKWSGGGKIHPPNSLDCSGAGQVVLLLGIDTAATASSLSISGCHSRLTARLRPFSYRPAEIRAIRHRLLTPRNYPEAPAFERIKD